MTKITEEQVIAAHQSHMSGVKLKVLARHYDVSPEHLSRRMRNLDFPTYNMQGRVQAAFLNGEFVQTAIRMPSTGDKKPKPPKSPKPLSARQRAIFDFIIRFKRENGGDSPTIREIMCEVGIPSTSVVGYNLNVLEARGLISRQSYGSSRRIAVVGGRWEYDGDN
jgi:hypothetical protein